ncbi:hypothetical protein [Nocardioides sp.]|uniref:hypothetical protein n=1 Tax=Nocardioides sp. TaxID=35761 RepID=UPI003528BF50
MALDLPPDFVVPLPPPHPAFRFEVLGPEHNESDLAAWSASIEHIHATQGFRADGWPERVYTLEENLADLVRHREHHERGEDFAWTVLDPADGVTVVGCAYLKPDPTGEADGTAHCWVRADLAASDEPLRSHLRAWYAAAWPISVRWP